MGMAGPIFELHPSNLVRIHMFLSCKNAENFVTKSLVVLELAKISVSVPSISRGVLGLANQAIFYWKMTFTTEPGKKV